MRFRALCGVVLLAACEPAVTSPVKVMAIVPNRTGTYDTRQVEITTADSIVHMTGSLLTLVGGAQIEIPAEDPPAGATNEQLFELMMKNKGQSVRASFVDKSGVLWPADFHSWAMTTTYYNYEQAFAYYQKIYNGKSTEELKNIRVFYWAGFKDLTGLSDLDQRDNAIFLSTVGSFMVLPFEKFQKVPLSLNIGVIGHEFAHLVFNKKVYEGAALPLPLVTWSLAPFNLLKSMDEGFADFHGYGVTCTTAASGSGCLPSFLSASIADKDVLAARNIADATHCMTAELRSAFNNFQPTQFTRPGLQYKIGTLIATSLYQASAPLGKEDVMQKALIESLDDPSAAKPGFRQVINLNLQTQQAFTPELMVNTIAIHISDLDLKRQVCKQLSDRLQLAECPSFPCDAVPACDSATKGTSCPVLPPQ